MKENYCFTQQRYKRTLKKELPFVLIGNRIDGRINFGIEDFKDIDDLRLRLSGILKKIEGEGEWDVILYQVPPNYKIRLYQETYEYPKPGKQVFRYSYMFEQVVDAIINDKTMVICCKEEYTDRGWNKNEAGEYELEHNVFEDLILVDMKWVD